MNEELKQLVAKDAAKLLGLEELAKQKPVAWTYTINRSHSVFSAEKPPEDAYDKGTLYPLYAAPVVQPGMVMVPREPTEAMIASGYSQVTMEIENSSRDISDVYMAMIAAAEEEGK